MNRFFISKKTRLLLLIGLPAIIIAGALAALLAPNDSAEQSGSLRIRVIDVISEQPLKNAKVIIPEINKAFLTDENGVTETITVPLIRDAQYERILPQPWGRITVLVYADGYQPYALFFVHVTKDKQRYGPTVYMFPDDLNTNGEPVSVIESPDDEWIGKLLNKFDPLS